MVVCTILGTLVGLGMGYYHFTRQPAGYESSARVRVSVAGAATDAGAVTTIRSQPVLDRAAQSLGFAGAADLATQIQATPAPAGSGADLILTARGPDAAALPKYLRAVVDAYRAELASRPTPPASAPSPPAAPAVNELAQIDADRKRAEQNLLRVTTEDLAIVQARLTANLAAFDKARQGQQEATREIDLIASTGPARPDRLATMKALGLPADAPAPLSSADSPAPNALLLSLQSKKAELGQRLGPEHRDMIALDEQIERLKAESGKSAPATKHPDELDRQRGNREADNALLLALLLKKAELGKRLGPDHRDMVALDEQIERLKAPSVKSAPVAKLPDELDRHRAKREADRAAFAERAAALAMVVARDEAILRDAAPIRAEIDRLALARQAAAAKPAPAAQAPAPAPQLTASVELAAPPADSTQVAPVLARSLVPGGLSGLFAGAGLGILIAMGLVRRPSDGARPPRPAPTRPTAPAQAASVPAPPPTPVAPLPTPPVAPVAAPTPSAAVPAPESPRPASTVVTAAPTPKTAPVVASSAPAPKPPLVVAPAPAPASKPAVVAAPAPASKAAAPTVPEIPVVKSGSGRVSNPPRSGWAGRGAKGKPEGPDLGVTLLGQVPTIRTDLPVERKTVEGLAPSLVCFHRPNGPESEAFRTTRRALASVLQDRGHQVILVSSPGPGDGKSTVAANLAISLAQSGKRAILVDCDLAAPKVQELFRINRLGDGLRTVMTAEADLRVAVRTCEIGNLFLLPAGRGPMDPVDMLTRPKFRELLAELRSMYEYVIVDGPPTTATKELLALAGSVDGGALVVGSTPDLFDRSSRGIAGLTTAGIRVLGGVANAATPRADAAPDPEPASPAATVVKPG